MNIRDAMPVLVACLLTGCATMAPQTADQRREAAQTVIQGWSEKSRIAAAALLEEFGAPDRVDSSRLLWVDKHLFKRVVAWDQVPGDEWGEDVIEAAVSYRVPPQMRSELAAFSDKIRVSPDGKELAAHSDSEASAILALNLANEIVLGIQPPQQARAVYSSTQRLKAAGKVSPLIQGLIFLPRRE